VTPPLSSALAKLGMTDRVQLVIFAYEHGWCGRRTRSAA
jgi:DNA-binding NarL/FixJ family response regulator